MVKKAEVEKKQNPYLPVMGLFMAIAYSAVAYGAAPLVVGLIKDYAPLNANQLYQLTSNEGSLTNAFAVFIWLILFSLTMLIVAAAIGEDPHKEDTMLRPREGASEKEWQRYEKHLAKTKERRLKRAEEVAKQQAEAQKKGKR